MTYIVFHRTWWRRNKDWPEGLEPCAGKMHKIATYVPDEETAQKICKEWNASHDAGELSDKAEYMEVD